MITPRTESSNGGRVVRIDLFLRVAVTAMLICQAIAWGGVARAAIAFVYPAEKSLVLRSDYLILKFNDPDMTGVKVTINGAESDILQVGTPEYRKTFRDFLILQSVWDPGKNAIRIDGYIGSKIVETVTTDIMYNQDFNNRTDTPEFVKVLFHSAGNEKLCSPCHNMNPTAAQSDDSLGKGNPCYVCHNKMINISFVHGPAGTFSCQACHVGKEGFRYAVSRQDAQLCAECHVEQVADFKKKKFQHGPIEADMCEICHDPHGSAFPAQLRAPINVLCLSCHEEVGKGVHVIAVPNGGGHPLAEVPDPSRPGSGRQMSCISCHNPHAGDVRYYFQNNAETSMGLCLLCHNR